jgi:hypothetical protein
VGVELWVTARFGLPWLSRWERKAHLGALLALAALGLGLGAAALALFGPEIVGRYRASTALWNEPRRNEFWFYHSWLNLYYPSLWPLFPFVALAAVARWPRPALFCLAVFVPAMTLHAFAAAKLLTARLRSQGTGSRLRLGWARRWSMRRIMARVIIASETSGSSS